MSILFYSILYLTVFYLSPTLNLSKQTGNETMSHIEQHLSECELELTCDLGDCMVEFSIMEIDSQIDAHVEAVKALDEDDGEYKEVEGEELYRWKALLDTRDNKDFALEQSEF